MVFLARLPVLYVYVITIETGLDASSETLPTTIAFLLLQSTLPAPSFLPGYILLLDLAHFNWDCVCLCFRKSARVAITLRGASEPRSSRAIEQDYQYLQVFSPYSYYPVVGSISRVHEPLLGTVRIHCKPAKHRGPSSLLP
jgi:hypothetical protein